MNGNRYNIISGKTVKELVENVNNFVNEEGQAWKPIGPFVCVPTLSLASGTGGFSTIYFHQTMGII